MSQVHLVIGGRLVVAGYDKPFETYFAQVFESDEKYPDVPDYCCGYHPAEQALCSVDTRQGPFPIKTLDKLVETVRADTGVLIVGRDAEMVRADRRRETGE